MIKDCIYNLRVTKIVQKSIRETIVKLTHIDGL